MHAQALTARIALTGLSAEDCALLPAAYRLIASELDAVLDDFYAAAAADPELAALVGGQVPRLKAAQRAHWEEIFTGRFDEDYLERATAIGRAHHRIGLKPEWYASGYTRILARLSSLLIRACRWNAGRAAALVAAVEKAILIDMEIAISVYIEASEATVGRRLNETADAIVAEIAGAIEQAERRAQDVRQLTETMSAAASGMTAQAESAKDAAGATSERITATASATEQLSASIKEIAGVTHRSGETADRAAATAGEAAATIQALSDAVGKITGVVGLISEVAQQTNMLALNATIEAARAGAAGKGFAVVASEVKQLAGQTARATGEITTHIAGIEQATGAAVTAVREVVESVRAIREGTASVAAAVEQQAAATGEISANVAAVRDQTAGVSGNVVEVLRASATAARQTEEVRAAFSRMEGDVQLLSTQVNGILHRLRAPAAAQASAARSAK